MTIFKLICCWIKVADILFQHRYKSRHFPRKTTWNIDCNLKSWRLEEHLYKIRRSVIDLAWLRMQFIIKHHVAPEVCNSFFCVNNNNHYKATLQCLAKYITQRCHRFNYWLKLLSVTKSGVEVYANNMHVWIFLIMKNPLWQ